MRATNAIGERDMRRRDAIEQTDVSEQFLCRSSFPFVFRTALSGIHRIHAPDFTRCEEFGPLLKPIDSLSAVTLKQFSNTCPYSD